MKATKISMSWDDLQALLALLDAAMLGGNVANIREILLEAPLGYTPSSEIVDCLWLNNENNTCRASRRFTTKR